MYTDGACSGNPGPGGWGAVLRYKGVEKELSGGEAATAVLGGHADMTFLFPQNYAPMASADKLKILAIGTKSDVYPNAPTFAEQGYEGNYYGWAGIAAPKGTPKEILDRLAAISEEIVKDPEYIKAIKNMNATPEAWMKQIKEQYAEMNKVLTDLGLTGNK